MTILLTALAGLSVGGAIAFYRQHHPRWMPLLLLVVGVLLLWAAYGVSSP
ncbi:MAG TPA: hypothetical protein VFJ14_04965 [Nocardioidaceae bacterium]|nr:hypothetical protein [Nocardioidaceae bacterium]